MNRFFGMEEILVESLGWWEKEREGREGGREGAREIRTLPLPR